MAGRQAKILSDEQLDRLLEFATHHTRYPLRNRLIVLLSVKAGLRAGEISKLTWPMVTDATGAVSLMIELHNKAAKKGGGRGIPLNAQLREALMKWRGSTISTDVVITSERDQAMAPRSIVNWFAIAYRTLEGGKVRDLRTNNEYKYAKQQTL